MDPSLNLYFGPMYSKKTSNLLSDLTLHADLGHKVLLVSYLGSESREETYKDSNISSHSSQFFRVSPKIRTIKVKELKNVDISEYQVIGVDEAQFFPDLKPTVLLWLMVGNRKIICAGLDADYNRQPFNIDPQTPNGILSLIPHANEACKLHAKCQRCLDEKGQLVNAAFTARLVDNREQVLIGGSKEYSPMCFYHHQLHLLSKRCLQSSQE
jgi:thymidine kinase